MLSAGQGCRGPGFLLPGLHRASYERLCGGFFAPSPRAACPRGHVAAWLPGCVGIPARRGRHRRPAGLPPPPFPRRWICPGRLWGDRTHLF